MVHALNSPKCVSQFVYENGINHQFLIAVTTRVSIMCPIQHLSNSLIHIIYQLSYIFEQLLSLFYLKHMTHHYFAYEKCVNIIRLLWTCMYYITSEHNSQSMLLRIEMQQLTLNCINLSLSNYLYPWPFHCLIINNTPVCKTYEARMATILNTLCSAHLTTIV